MDIMWNRPLGEPCWVTLPCINPPLDWVDGSELGMFTSLCCMLVGKVLGMLPGMLVGERMLFGMLLFRSWVSRIIGIAMGEGLLCLPFMLPRLLWCTKLYGLAGDRA